MGLPSTRSPGCTKVSALSLPLLSLRPATKTGFTKGPALVRYSVGVDGRVPSRVMDIAKLPSLVSNAHRRFPWLPRLEQRQVPLNLPFGDLAVVLPPLLFF